MLQVAPSGIGKATAILFAEHGAKIVVADIDEHGANQTVATITNAGNEAILRPNRCHNFRQHPADGTGDP